MSVVSDRPMVGREDGDLHDLTDHDDGCQRLEEAQVSRDAGENTVLAEVKASEERHNPYCSPNHLTASSNSV